MATVNGTSSSSTFCSHCERDVPSANFDLHSAHCKRNLERCRECQEMVARVRAEEHYNEFHAPAECTLCGTKIKRELMPNHELHKCPKRLVACEYCEFPVAAAELPTHLDVCGSRTELCIPCGRYVRLREKLAHDLQFHSDNHEIAAPLRDFIPRSASTTSTDIGRRTLPPSRPPPPLASRHRLMFTFAITGVAILIGTLALQRRGPNQRSPQ